MAQCIITPDSNYNYCPSFAAAILFASLFGLSTGTHLVQAIVYRKKFCWVIVMGGLWETGGFAVRALSSRNIASIAPVTVSQLLILLSPLWINAFDYMILGRVVHYYLPSKKIWIRADRLALCFVLLDITAFLIQAAGGSMASSDNPPKTIQLGLHIYMGGIGFQEFFLFISKITIYLSAFSVFALVASARLEDLLRKRHQILVDTQIYLARDVGAAVKLIGTVGCRKGS